MARLNERDWGKTPYAKTEAKNTESDMRNLLGRYGVREYMLGEATGPNGRPGVVLRFKLQGKQYRVGIEILDAPSVDELRRMLQLKRAVYYWLKATLEMTSVFFSVEESLFAFREVPGAGGRTVAQVIRPALERAEMGEEVDGLRRLSAVALPYRRQAEGGPR